MQRALVGTVHVRHQRRPRARAASLTSYAFDVGKHPRGKPERLGEGGGSAVEEPIDDEVLEAAIRCFVDGFVIESKRERAQRLLRGRPARWTDTMEHLPTWVEPALQTELVGNASLPKQLQERFGSLRGVLIDSRGARRTTIAGAMWTTTTSNGSGALFVSDSGELALLVPETGPPSLCHRTG
jgi:hypothetical protein